MMSESQLQDVTYALACSPGFAQDGLCFAARASGLYRSADGGRTWQSAYTALSLTSPLPTMAVAVSPDFASDRTVLAGVEGGILRSDDRGRHWETVSQPSPPPVITSLAISPHYAHDGLALAGTVEDGVFRSTDKGRQWAAWNFGLLDLNVLCIALSPRFAEDETVFIGAETGIFRSANGGRSWREVAFPTELAPVLSLAISSDHARPGALFAGTEAHGLFRSDDGGQTWARLGENVIAEAVNQIILSPNFANSATPDVLALLSEALLISHDGGQTWSDWKAGLDLTLGATCVAAPRGLASRAPMLIGRVEGGVLRL